MTYAEWTATWCIRLSTMITERSSKAIFLACRAACRKDVNVAQFVLPHLVCEVLTSGKRTCIDEVTAELDDILSRTEALEEPGSQSLRARISWTMDEASAVEDFDRLATQTVFAVLDYLTKWMREKQNAMIVALQRQNSRNSSEALAAAKSKDKAYTAVETFVESVSQKRLATASYHCQAYARSLLHWERHISANPEELQSAVFTLQQVCGTLQEQDLVVGFAAARKGEPSEKELIYQHEIAGEYADALACYERSSDKDTVENAKGKVRCYLEMAMPGSAMTHAKGAAAGTDPKAEQQLKKYRYEAAWQLAQWEEVDEKDDGVHAAKDWGVTLAGLLKSVKVRDAATFEKVLASALRAEVGGVTAAAMEQGAYERSYHHIVKLQILDEIKDMVDGVLFKEDELPSAEAVEIMLNAWRDRSRMCIFSPMFQEPVIKVRDLRGSSFL